MTTGPVGWWPLCSLKDYFITEHVVKYPHCCVSSYLIRCITPLCLLSWDYGLSVSAWVSSLWWQRGSFFFMLLDIKNIILVFSHWVKLPLVMLINTRNRSLLLFTFKSKQFTKAACSLEIFHKRSWLLNQNDVMVYCLQELSQ